MRMSSVSTDASPLIILKKRTKVDPAFDCPGIANLDSVTFLRHLLYA